jgi:MFS family permease
MKVPGGLLALRRSFAIRDYRLFVIGNLISNVGLWTQRVALGWLTWELTHSTAWLGGIAIAESIPTFVFALLAGTIVDRVDYFKLLRITQSLSLAYAVVMAGLVLFDWINIWLLVAVVVVRGSVTAFNRPSRMTVIFSMVGRDLLVSAVAINSIIFNVSRFIGPAIGGGLIVYIGIGWTFAATAAMFFVFTITLMLIKTPITGQPEREQRSILAETIDGLRYMFVHPGIRMMMLMLMVLGFLGKPITDLLPGFVGQVFDRGPDGLALLLSANGAGAMIGASWMASRGGGVKGLTLVSITGILIVSFGLLGFVMVPVFWMSLPLIGLIGFAFILQNVANQTLLQSAADPGMRGRVISNYGLFHQGLPAIGTLSIGAIAETTGLRLPVAVAASLCLVLWLWSFIRRRVLISTLENDPDAAAQLHGKGRPAPRAHPRQR